MWLYECNKYQNWISFKKLVIIYLFYIIYESIINKNFENVSKYYKDQDLVGVL